MIAEGKYKPPGWSLKGLEPWNKGKTGTVPEKQLAKMIEARRHAPYHTKGYTNSGSYVPGHTVSPKVREKLRTSHLGHPSPRKGKKHSPESREKMRQSMMKRIQEGRIDFAALGAAMARAMATKKPTSIERITAAYLREKGVVFKSQVAVGSRFVADFYVESQNLVIECDGKYWHSFESVKEKDRRKDKYLFEQGYRVIRLGEDEINDGRFREKLKGVLRQK